MKINEKIVLLDIDYTLFNTDIFKKSNHSEYQLYEEILETLEVLSNISTLGIFSEGDNNFQRMKLKKTKALRFFKEAEYIHIMVDKLSELEQVLSAYIHTQVYIIDDKLEVLFHIKQRFPSITVIWVRRGTYAKIQKPIPNFTPDAIISNLKDAVPIVAAA